MGRFSHDGSRYGIPGVLHALQHCMDYLNIILSKRCWRIAPKLKQDRNKTADIIAHSQEGPILPRRGVIKFSLAIVERPEGGLHQTHRQPL